MFNVCTHRDMTSRSDLRAVMDLLWKRPPTRGAYPEPEMMQWIKRCMLHCDTRLESAFRT